MLLGFLDLRFGSCSCDCSGFDRSSVDGFSDASGENTPVKGPRLSDERGSARPAILTVLARVESGPGPRRGPC